MGSAPPLEEKSQDVMDTGIQEDLTLERLGYQQGMSS